MVFIYQIIKNYFLIANFFIRILRRLNKLGVRILRILYFLMIHIMFRLIFNELNFNNLFLIDFSIIFVYIFIITIIIIIIIIDIIIPSVNIVVSR